MDCLELAKVYAILVKRRDYMLRMIERKKQNIRIDQEIISDMGKGAYPKLKREVRNDTRLVKRYRYRLGTIAPLLEQIERALKHKRVSHPTQKEVKSQWPSWMDHDGKLKQYQ